MDETLFDTNWLKLKKTNFGYVYSERKGVDSVAVLLSRKNPETNRREYLVRWQFVPTLSVISNDQHTLMACPITGSIELNEDNVYKTAVREVKEETGYTLSMRDLKFKGRYQLGTQSNESVYTFYAIINKDNETEIPEGDGTEREAESHNQWMDHKDFKFLIRKSSRVYSILKLLYLVRNEE